MESAVISKGRTCRWTFIESLQEGNAGVRPTNLRRRGLSCDSMSRMLPCVLQVSGLRITKAFDLFMLQATRRAKLMRDERYICQMLDYLHLLKGLQYGSAVTDCAMIGHKDSVMVWDERGETSCHLCGSRCGVIC